jgi:predicted O-methyltransferase YrrM
VIPERVATVLRRLEEQDARDRIDGSPQVLRLRQIPREVGEFLHTLVLAANAQTIVEIGTSAGYSTLWLALATQQTGGRVITFEIDPAKVGLARRSFADAGLADAIDLKHVDARDGIGDVDTGSVDLTSSTPGRTSTSRCSSRSSRRSGPAVSWSPTTSPRTPRSSPRSANWRSATRS